MNKLIVLLVILAASVSRLSMAADAEPKGADTNAATSVKSGKSNSSDRASGGNTDAAAKVKSSKSNSSERGQGGGAVDAATTVKSGKSNTSE